MGFDVGSYGSSQRPQVDSSSLKQADQASPTTPVTETDLDIQNVANSVLNNQGVSQSEGDIRQEAEELLNHLDSLAKEWETMFGTSPSDELEDMYNQALDNAAQGLSSQVDEEEDERQEQLLDKVLDEVIEAREQGTAPEPSTVQDSPAEPSRVPTRQDKGKEKMDSYVAQTGDRTPVAQKTASALAHFWPDDLKESRSSIETDLSSSSSSTTEDPSAPLLGRSRDKEGATSEKEVITRKQSLRFKIWRLISRLTSLISPNNTKLITRISLKSGLVKIEELQPQLITKLSPKWIGRVAPDQFRQLERHHFAEMTQSQLFAIGPSRLGEIGPKNMAYIVKNRLEPEASNNFIEWIAKQQFTNDRFEAGLVKEFFNELGEKETNKFLRSLSLQLSEMVMRRSTEQEQKLVFREFRYLYQLLKGPTEFEYSHDILQEFLEAKEESFQKVEDKSFTIEDATLTPIGIIMDDASRMDFIVNGGKVDNQVEDADEASKRLLTAIYEGTGKDQELTNRIQYFTNQRVFAPLQVDVLSPHYALWGDESEENPTPRVGFESARPSVKIDIDPESNLVTIKNEISFPLKELGSEATFGYINVVGVFTIPIDELKSGEIPNAKGSWEVSKVYKTLKEAQIEETDHPERRVEGGSKAVDKDLRARKATNKDAVFDRKQAELKQHYSDSLALELLLQEMTYMVDTRARVRQAANQDLSIKELIEKFQNDPSALAVINKFRSALEKEAAETGNLFDQTRPLDREDIQTLDKVYGDLEKLVDAPRGENYFGFFASKDQSPNSSAWQSDQQMIRDLILSALNDYQGQELDDEQKNEIRTRVFSELDEKIGEAEANVIYVKQLIGTYPGTVTDVAYAKKKDFVYRDEVNHFKEDLIKAIKAGYANARDKAENIANPPKELASALVYEIPENDLKALREKYIKGQTSDGDSEIMLGDIFEEVLNALDLKEYRKEEYIEKYADQLIEEAMVTFFDTPVNFPDKAKALAEVLLDEVLNHPLRS